MKKQFMSIIAFIILPISVNAKETFTGWSVGGELIASKHRLELDSVSKTKSKFSPSIAAFSLYGFNYGNNFIGLVEGKLKIGGSTAKLIHNDEEISKEKYQISVSYLQGYRIYNLLPYIKVSANVATYDFKRRHFGNVNIEGNGAFGLGVGIGAKYAIEPNIDIGVEYHKIYMRNIENTVKLPTQNIGVNLAYHF